MNIGLEQFLNIYRSTKDIQKLVVEEDHQLGIYDFIIHDIHQDIKISFYYFVNSCYHHVVFRFIPTSYYFRILDTNNEVEMDGRQVRKILQDKNSLDVFIWNMHEFIQYRRDLIMERAFPQNEHIFGA